MKKFSRILFLGLAFTAFAAVKSNAQIEVSIRPEVPREYVVVRRPPPPSPRHVWVEAEWKGVHGHYVYRPGFWDVPPPGYHAWVKGYWMETPRHGNVWVRGHWA